MSDANTNNSGIGLDYDIFLISRIQEYRAKGYTETSSIVKGLVKTGSIITAAGMIMAIAFSGLLFTTSGVLYQMAFLLVLAVLLDTLVVRLFLVPAIMQIFADLGMGNFFPASYLWSWPPPLHMYPVPENGSLEGEDSFEYSEI